MHIANILDLSISVDTMNKYVVGTAGPKTLMHMISVELDTRAREVYPDAMEEIFHFQEYVTLE